MKKFMSLFRIPFSYSSRIKDGLRSSFNILNFSKNKNSRNIIRADIRWLSFNTTNNKNRVLRTKMGVEDLNNIFIKRAISNFIKGAIHLRFEGVKFEENLSLIFFIKSFDPKYKITHQSIYNIKTRKIGFKPLIITEEVQRFIKHIKTQFPSFQDKWLFKLPTLKNEGGAGAKDILIKNYKEDLSYKHIKHITPAQATPIDSSHQYENVDVIEGVKHKEFNDKQIENNDKSLSIYDTKNFNLMKKEEYNFYKYYFKESHLNTKISPPDPNLSPVEGIRYTGTENRTFSNIKLLIINGDLFLQRLALEYIHFIPFINIFYNIFILSIFGGYDEYSSVWVESNIQSEVVYLDKIQTLKTETPENLNINTGRVRQVRHPPLLSPPPPQLIEEEGGEIEVEGVRDKTSNFWERYMQPSYIESKKKFWGIFDIIVNPDNYLYIPSFKQSNCLPYTLYNWGSIYGISKDWPGPVSESIIFSECGYNQTQPQLEVGKHIEYKKIDWYELDLTHPIISKFRTTSDIFKIDNSNEEISNGIRVRRDSAPSILQHGEFILLKDTQSPTDSLISVRDVTIMELNNSLAEKNRLIKSAFRALKNNLFNYKGYDIGKTQFSTGSSLPFLHDKTDLDLVEINRERNNIIFELTLKNLKFTNALESYNKETDFYNKELLEIGIELSKVTDPSELIKINDETLDKLADLENRLISKTHELSLAHLNRYELENTIKKLSEDNYELNYKLKINEEELNQLKKDFQEEKELSTDYIKAYHEAQESNEKNKNLAAKLQSQVSAFKTKLDFYIEKEKDWRALEELVKNNL